MNLRQGLASQRARRRGAPCDFPQGFMRIGERAIRAGAHGTNLRLVPQWNTCLRRRTQALM